MEPDPDELFFEQVEQHSGHAEDVVLAVDADRHRREGQLRHRVAERGDGRQSGTGVPIAVGNQ